MMERGQELGKSDNPEVAAAGQLMYEFAARILEAVVGSVDELVALQESKNVTVGEEVAAEAAV
jgi:hypothetical protein